MASFEECRLAAIAGSGLHIGVFFSPGFRYHLWLAAHVKVRNNGGSAIASAAVECHRALLDEFSLLEPQVPPAPRLFELVMVSFFAGFDPLAASCRLACLEHWGKSQDGIP